MFIEVVGIYLDSLSLSHLYVIVFQSLDNAGHCTYLTIQDKRTSSFHFSPGLVPQVSKKSFSSLILSAIVARRLFMQCALIRTVIIITVDLKNFN